MFTPSLSYVELAEYVRRQLSSFFNDNNQSGYQDIDKFVSKVFEKLEYCFSKIKKKYFCYNGGIHFNHLNSDQYAMFLYMLSNLIFKMQNNEQLSTKLFLLNKALHGLDVFYSVELPDIFLFVHPVGTVIGNAKYSDYFVIYQNCTVGSNLSGIYPVFEQGVVLLSKSTVIGESHIGSDTYIGSNTFILNTSVDKNSTVVGMHPNNRIIKHNRKVSRDYFGLID